MFKKIITAITAYFTREKPVVEDAFTKANSIVNVLKTFTGSVPGQAIEAIIEMVLPGASTAIFIALNTFFSDYGIVTNAVGAIQSETAAAGLNKLISLDGDSRTLALSNIAAVIGHAASSVNGGVSTLQQAIVIAPVVYNPDVLNDPIPD